MMNPREKTLAIVVGGIVGLGAVYQAVHLLFLKPAAKAAADIAELESQNNYLDGVIRSRRNLADRWNAALSRTLAFDRPEASNKIAQALKNGAKRHGFENPGFFPNSVGSKIGSAKSGITTVSYRITAEGPFKNAMAFLTDIYRSPYMCDISRLSITPLLQRNRPRGDVKIEFLVESPLMPVIDPKKVPELVNTASLPGEGADQLGPSRDDIPPDEELVLLGRRNIFRPFVPPPSNVVMIDNQDWKTVAVRAKFFWEGEVNRQTVDGNVVEEIVKTVASKSKLELRGLGDAVEIQGTYADGKSFGPQRLEFATKKDWSYAVAVHSLEPPPDAVLFFAENQHSTDVVLDITSVDPGGKAKNHAPILLRTGSKIDDQYIVKTMTVTATYPSGRKAPSATYTPSKDKQTYLVPVEPVETPPDVVVDSSDQPPDASLTVTGLVTYRGKQELIASAGPADRRIIAAGEEAVVDGGTLLGVHPLGGVVKMPSGNYYIYPLGRPFTQRVKLDAKSDQELPAAIDAWSRPDSGETEKESEAETAAIEAVAGE